MVGQGVTAARRGAGLGPLQSLLCISVGDGRAMIKITKEELWDCRDAASHTGALDLFWQGRGDPQDVHAHAQAFVVRHAGGGAGGRV